MGGLSTTEELWPGVFRLRLSGSPRLAQHTCVRRFVGRGRSVGVLFSPVADLSAFDSVLTEPFGSELHYAVLFDPEPETAMGAAALQQRCGQLRILCSRDTFRLARYHGLDVRRTVFMDDLAHGELTLPSGHLLRCLPAHHCPARGAAMVLDREARLLFTGSLFASAELHEPLLGLRAWHEATMPATRWLQDAVSRAAALQGQVDRIVPTYGQTWSGCDLRDAVDLLSMLSVGIDVEDACPAHVVAAREVLAELDSLLGVESHADDPSFPVLCRVAGEVVGFRVSSALALDVLARTALSSLPPSRRGQMRRALADIERLRRVTIAPARPSQRPASR